MKINDNIYLLGGAEQDSNVYFIDGELLIDCGSGEFMEQTLGQMKRLGLHMNGIKAILLTHGHANHAGAVADWKKKTKAKVLVHAGDIKFVDQLVKPDILAKEGETIKTRNYTFRVLETPGHSAGGVCLWDEKAGVLVSGDTLHLDNIGVVGDGGNEKELIASLKKLKKLATSVKILLPSHGAPGVIDSKYTGFRIKQVFASIK